MTRFIPAIVIPAIAILTASCGCKPELDVPPLRKEPKFNPVGCCGQHSHEAPVVTPTK